MPTIPYSIQKSVQKVINGRKRWFVEYETIDVNVSDEIVAFLTVDDKREQRYQWKIKKQKQDAKIHTEFSFDEIKKTSDGDEFLVADLIEDSFHFENFDPFEILIERQERKAERIRAKKFAAILNKFYFEILTKKQYVVWKYHNNGYSNSIIARHLGIDESSVRERLKNAKKRIENPESKKIFLKLIQNEQKTPENS